MSKPYLPPEFWDAAKDVELPRLPKIGTTMKNTPGGLVCECSVDGGAMEEWAKEVARLMDDATDAAIVSEIAERNGYAKERTCTFSECWDDEPLPTCSACGWEAEETDCVTVIGGPYLVYDGKFCKECGAKVVE